MFENLIEKLERTVEYYRCGLANSHKLQRRSPKRLPQYKPLWDLPMMASSCCYEYHAGITYSSIYSDYSQPVKSNSYDSVIALKARLLECAPDEDKRIGATTKLPYCGNEVGRCAEPHAAKQCMKKLSIKDDDQIDSLIFSIAHVIKTGEPRNPCAICQKVFPKIKVFPKLK